MQNASLQSAENLTTRLLLVNKEASCIGSQLKTTYWPPVYSGGVLRRAEFYSKGIAMYASLLYKQAVNKPATR